MILSKSQLINNINNDISDQAYGQISPYDIRHNLLDIIDSIHNLTLSNNLTSLNLSTFSEGNTKVGQFTLENASLNGYSSQDNTAIGYSALKSNYQSTRNTAVGSYSLSCNIYGQSNVALGYTALAGNTVGNLNVALGGYALHNNKSGNGNIAIGHGAGYYINKSTNNKLFIAYHPVDSNYVCSNPDGSGLIPLIYGDLIDLKLGVGVRNLHAYGKLQVGGDVTPSGDGVLDIGHQYYNWKNLYLSKSIEFNNSSFIRTSGISNLLTGNNLYPYLTNKYSLGSASHVWMSGHFKDLVVTGTATITQANFSNTAIYGDKTFYLGVNSSYAPLFSDDLLENGGLVLKSSTSSKEYKLSFRPPNQGMPCFDGSYNAVWYSNINFQVPSDRYIKTNSVVSYSPDSFGNADCFGLFFNSGITYISRKNVLDLNPGLPNGHIAGISNINFISNSGEANDYGISISSLESGVSVSQKFLSGTKSRIKDITTGKDKLSGFEIKYIDNFSNTSLNDRLVIGSYNKTPNFVNGLILMKESTDGSVLSVTNIPNITQDVIPNTILNVRSKNDCVARFTSENNGYYKSAIQLIGSENCLSSGVEIAYLNNSGIADIVIYKNELGINAIRITDSGSMGIFSSGITNEVITIGHSGMKNIPVISLKDSAGVLSSSVVASSGYGKLYTLKNDKPYARQNNELVFMDSSGNSFNLVVNKNDNIDARAVFTDTFGNTFAGYQSPSGRLNITSSTANNISYGYRSLYSLVSGSGNISLGANSSYTLTSGNNNILIGKNTGNGLIKANNNIVIGNDSFKVSSNFSNTSGNIIIGHDGIGNSASGSYNFLVGSKENIILLEGKLGPDNSDKMLALPSGGKFFIHNNNNTESLCFKANTIEVIDSGGTDYPENELIFKFTGNNSNNLFVLNHVANPIAGYSSSWNTPVAISYDGSTIYSDSFWFPATGLFSNLSPKPYAQLNGNLRIQGNIQFSDGTYLGSTKYIKDNNTLANSGISLGNSGIAIGNSGLKQISQIFIEGFMPTGLSAPAAGQKTSGIMIPKDNTWANSGTLFITNRDTTSIIHSGAYVVAARVNGEYKPVWVSSNVKDNPCPCCHS